MTDLSIGFDGNNGQPPPRHIDPITESLAAYAKAFEDFQKLRIAASNRGDEFAAALAQDSEKQCARRLEKALKQHVLWRPFLVDKRGLHGARVGRLIGLTGDPRRFPGQQCSMGHTLPPLYSVGSSCPVVAVRKAGIDVPFGDDGAGRFAHADGTDAIDEQFGTGDNPATDPKSEIDGETGGGEAFVQADAVRATERPSGMDDHPATDPKTVIDGKTGGGVESCRGTMLAPRTSDGPRSLHHYLGLHPVDGHLARRERGKQADWSPAGRTLILGPQGIAAQIVMHRTPPYREIYDETKARKVAAEYPLWRADKIARLVASKSFVGDLLMAWKALAT